MRPRLLDLYSCAGGAGMGYHRAGFDVVGVDIRPQPRYPFEFHQGDALAYLREHGRQFDAIHASPPCQDHSVTRHQHKTPHGTGDLLAATRKLLEAQPAPWIIENVPGAPMRTDVRLCGCMFDDLPGLRRERWFETSWRAFDLRPPCWHRDKTITVAGHAGGSSKRDGMAGRGSTEDWRRAMGMPWASSDELAQAIPPAYTEYLGGLLLEQLAVAA